MIRRRIHFNAVQILTGGFACLILVGAGLLMLPISSRSGQSIPFVNALFTSASASCVTGLVLYDTWTQFTIFGQAVLMVLIQVGGLGFMTLSILVAILLHRRIGLHQRSVLMDTIGALQVGGVVRLTRRALAVTAAWEGTGAVLLAFWFCPRYGLARGLWMAVFHAVSAFCNAGFDLLGTGASLATEADEPLLSLVIMALIIAGGLGFLVWDDVLAHRLNFRRYRLHSKLVITGTAALLVTGTVLFYIVEGDHAFSGIPTGQRLLMAAFQSVTCRTAGFNTADLMALSQAGILITMVLMFIGAGSGSTGGGIKVNTFAVLLLGIRARTLRKDDVNVFRRRLDEDTVRQAYSSAGLYTLTCVLGCLVLCLEGVKVDDALFEAISAIGTVGLTHGVTPTLGTASKVAITLLMFAGRVGSLSVAMAMTRDRPHPKVRNVPEKILIG